MMRSAWLTDRPAGIPPGAFGQSAISQRWKFHRIYSRVDHWPSCRRVWAPAQGG